MSGRHTSPTGLHGRSAYLVLILVLSLAAALAAAWRFGVLGGSAEGAAGPRIDIFEPAPEARAGTDAAEPAADPHPTPEPINSAFEGLTTFRGNASRTYYGAGPPPEDPEVLWRYPASGGLCGRSTDGAGTRVWCGTGWTGQPNVVETEGGRVEVRFGAYDYGVHVVGGRTGRPVKDVFKTGDIIKGTVTSDPDGYPLLYTGSRDDSFRVLALDRGRRMEELWSLHASSAPNPVWNTDWDGSALVVDDHLLQGGENSWFYVVKLNRAYDDAGRVTVDPEVRMLVPGYDDRLLADLGDQNVSIEGSIAFQDGVAYFANSGGLVQGWDVSDILAGGDGYERVFRFWTGDDTDATIVIDEEGYLYVASQLERFNARSREVGQLLKLDPTKPDDPLVWSLAVPGEGGDGGIWATPALHRRMLYVPTNTGRVLGVNRMTGKIRWELRLAPPTWSSPAVVDDVMIVGDCAGGLHAYDVSRAWSEEPPELWTVELEGCIESTPAVWKGMVYVGARGGAVYGIGDP